MKKLLALAMTVAFAFGLFCNAFAEEPYAVTEPIKIEFWHALSNDTVLKELVAAFEEENPLIEVDVIYQGSWTDINTKLSAALSANNESILPAVVTLNPSYIGSFVEDDVVAPLNDYIANDPSVKAEEFGKGMMDTFTWDGKVAALPYLTSAMVIYYNKTMAEAEGLEIPASWDEMEAFVEKASANDHKAIGFHAGGVWFFEPFFCNRMDVFGTDLEPTSRLDDPICVEVATAFQKWCQDGKAEWYYGSSAAADGREAFASGSIFAYCQSSATYQTLKKAVESSANFEIGMAMPVGGELGRYSMVGGQGISLVSKASEAKKNAGWQLIKYLTTEEANLALAEATGYLPTRTTTLTSEAGLAYQAKYPVFDGILAELDNITVQPRYYGSINGNTIWLAQMSEGIIEGGDMEKIMKNLNAEILEYIEENQ